MKEQTQKNFSYYIVTGLISLIILGFLFTGYQGSQMATQSDFGKVKGNKISMREFANTFNYQIQNFSQLFGGKSLNSKQIEQFKIYERVVDSLVDQKLILSIGQDLNIYPSKEEVSATIKEQPYFQRENKFDVNLYKALLKRNRFAPSEYEDFTRQDIITKAVQENLNVAPVSIAFAKESFEMKNEGIEAYIVQYQNSSLKRHLEVSKKEITDFLKDEKNVAIVKAMYEREKTSFQTGAQVKAKHILVKTDEKVSDADARKKIEKIKSEINANNFADLANKYTEDPSGKGKGGDLGWFGIGAMVPEFESVAFSLNKGEVSSPVKTKFGYHLILLEDKKEGTTKEFNMVKNDLAEKHLREQKSGNVKELAEKVAKQISDAFKKSDYKKVDELQKKYSFSYYQKRKLDGFSLNVSAAEFTRSEFDELMKLNKNEVVTYSNDKEQRIVKKLSMFSPKDVENTETEVKNEQQQLSDTLGKSNMANALKVLGEDVNKQELYQLAKQIRF
ncbi:MAG: SurA N-terminal domain-containing protein [Halobacteriovoraceae bacterium]|nr:SurA N-terminal domain-containing protein [Halobacteriovoraceae bacterium]